MTQRFFFKLLAIFIGMLGPSFTSSAQTADLKIYAGPQSITPRERVHVTVQSSLPETDVELTYNSDEGYEVQTGTTQQGFVSFEITAQKSVGPMQFRAKAGGSVSGIALVQVFAGPPQNFALSIKRGTQAGTLDISSTVLRDAFNNPISDVALARLDWIDDTGLKASQNIHLIQGQIILSGTCPLKVEGTLLLHAAVNSAIYISSDLSSLCAVNHEGRS